MSSCVFLFLPPGLVTSTPPTTPLPDVTVGGPVMSVDFESLVHTLWEMGDGHSGVAWGLALEGNTGVVCLAPQ